MIFMQIRSTQSTVSMLFIRLRAPERKCEVVELLDYQGEPTDDPEEASGGIVKIADPKSASSSSLGTAMIDPNALEWKLRKLRESVEMLTHAFENNRLYGIRHGGVPKPALGRKSNWSWQN